MLPVTDTTLNVFLLSVTNSALDVLLFYDTDTVPFMFEWHINVSLLI